MKHTRILGAVAVLSGLGIAPPLMAAETSPAVAVAPATGSHSLVGKPAQSCMSAVRSFTAEISKQGYWLGGSDYGYGYPMGGYGYGYDYGAPAGGRPLGNHATARPGYEIRTLISSANILAKTGNKQACEEVLASARMLYTRYAADLRDSGMSWTDQPDWRQKQIAAAQPVTDKDVSVRYDQLLDAKVVNPGTETLGSVQDLVTDPQTGKIAYVIISRGGLFGIDASHTPVPWSDFKVTPTGGVLVLDTTKAVLAAAPQGRGDQFTKAGQFDLESQKVDAYWTAHIKLASVK
jgi:sporulation protein YlmC with PRC-barrel domain